MKALSYLGMFFLLGCAHEELSLGEVTEAKLFWNSFIESYESGDASKLFELFEEPHSDIVKAYVNANSTSMKFAQKLYTRFGREGLEEFNNHNVFGGDVLSKDSSFSRFEPKVIGYSRKAFVLEHLGWKLKVNRSSDGKYRIKNSEEALSHLSIEHLSGKFEAYSYGKRKLADSSIALNDVSKLRDEIFNRFIQEAQKDFSRSLFE